MLRLGHVTGRESHVARVAQCAALSFSKAIQRGRVSPWLRKGRIQIPVSSRDLLRSLGGHSKLLGVQITTKDQASHGPLRESVVLQGMCTNQHLRPDINS
jgi:hypothetical protein